MIFSFPVSAPIIAPFSPCWPADAFAAPTAIQFAPGVRLRSLQPQFVMDPGQRTIVELSRCRFSASSLACYQGRRDAPLMDGAPSSSAFDGPGARTGFAAELPEVAIVGFRSSRLLCFPRTVVPGQRALPGRLMRMRCGALVLDRATSNGGESWEVRADSISAVPHSVSTPSTADVQAVLYSSSPSSPRAR